MKATAILKLQRTYFTKLLKQKKKGNGGRNGGLECHQAVLLCPSGCGVYHDARRCTRPIHQESDA